MKRKGRKRRLLYVDVAKGIGILLVVVGHNAICEPDSTVTAFIYSFHMPLFYFLAGLFHNRANNLFIHATNKARSLLLPCFLAFLVWVTYQGIAHDSFSKLEELCLDTLYGTGQTMFWGQLWFLTSLFLTTCVCHLILQTPVLRQKGIRLALALALIPIGIALVKWAPSLHVINIGEKWYLVVIEGMPWNVDILPITAAFYLFGTAFPKSRFENQAWTTKQLLLGAIVVFLFVGLGAFLMKWGMDLNKRQYDHWAGSTLLATCGIGGVLLLSRAFAKSTLKWLSQALSFVGKRSLIILVLHFSIQQNFFNKLYNMGSPWILSAVASFVIALGLPLLVYELWSKSRQALSKRKAKS